MNTLAPAKRHPRKKNMVLVARGLHRGHQVAIEEPDGTTTVAELDSEQGMCLDVPGRGRKPMCWLWTTREVSTEDETTDYTYPLSGAHVVIMRTRMAGGGLAYDGYVPFEQMHIPRDPPYPMTRHIHTWHARRGSRTFLAFDDATMPREFQRMPQGWDKYFACEAHRKAASKRLHRLACTVYPELRRLDDMPFLWVRGLVPEVEESHAERRVPLTAPAKAA